MRQLVYFLIAAVVLMSCVFTYAADAEEDLLIYLPFDEGQGNKAEDVGPNGFVGDIKNAKWVEGIAGQALQFKNGSVNFDPLKIDQPKEMTIEFWFKPDEEIEGGGRIDLLYRLNGGGRPHITFNRGGVLFGFYFATQGVEIPIHTNYDVFKPEWYYFVGSQSKQIAWMYINGELDAEAKAGGDARMDFGTQGMCIAASQGNANFFNGVIDEFKMWSFAFTAEDVKASMEETLAVNAGGKLTTTWGKLKSDSRRLGL
ncbi:MAG: LamG domain-containing protein [Candidatus Poribacteria bacterium]|nr:LamG domain-containing protein [Candidatus Poribacteria bacterium]